MEGKLFITRSAFHKAVQDDVLQSSISEWYKFNEIVDVGYINQVIDVLKIQNMNHSWTDKGTTVPSHYISLTVQITPDGFGIVEKIS